MRVLPFLLIGFVAAGAAFAADDDKDSGKKGAPGNNVEMPYVMAPMTGADGKLDAYAYIATLTVAADPIAALAVRDKLAFVQDAFVRDVNAAPVTSAAAPGKVDIVQVESRFTADAKRVVGSAKVKTVLVCSVQVAELHPRQTPDLNTPPKEAIQQAVKNGKPVKKSPCDV